MPGPEKKTCCVCCVTIAPYDREAKTIRGKDVHGGRCLANFSQETPRKRSKPIPVQLASEKTIATKEATQ